MPKTRDKDENNGDVNSSENVTCDPTVSEPEQVVEYRDTPMTEDQANEFLVKSFMETFGIEERVGTYWSGREAHEVNAIGEAITGLPFRLLTFDEQNLLKSFQMMKGGYLQAFLAQKARSHQLAREEVKEIKEQGYVCSLTNMRDSQALFTMPPGSGSTIGIIPGRGTGENQLDDGGYINLDAYQEQFIDEGKLASLGVKKVPYDPSNHMMNPPAVSSNGLPSIGYDDGGSATELTKLDPDSKLSPGERKIHGHLKEFNDDNMLQDAIKQADGEAIKLQ